MALAKSITKTLDISTEDVRIDLTATIKSYDLTDTQFIFDIQSSKGLTIDLTGSTAMYIVEYVHNSQTYAIEGDMTIVNPTKISFNLPEDLKGYNGTILIGLYVRLTDGTKIDIKEIAVRIEPSIMDKGLYFTAKSYFKDFEAIKAEVILEGEKAKTEIKAIVADVQSTGDTAKAEIKATLPTLQNQISELKSSIDNRILFDEELPVQTFTTLDIESSDIYKHDLYVTVTNNGTNVGYFTILVQKDNQTILTSTDGKGGTAVLLDVGESYTLPIWGLTNKFGAIGNYKILVQNTNNEKCHAKVFYNKIADNKIAEINSLQNQVSELKSNIDNHVLFDKELQVQTFTTLDIESSDVYKHDLYVKVTNNGTNLGYFTIIVQKNNKNILTSTDGEGGTAVLLDVGESYTLPIRGLTNKFGAIGDYKILVQNINNEKCHAKVFYNKIAEINSLLYKIPFTMVTVSSKGDGDFSDIQTAIDYLKNNFDVNNVHTIVLVKPGTYQVFPRKTPTKHNAYPAIDKGANRISIIGIERDMTRILVINSEEACGEIMSVGGDCVIKNLKFESYAGTASSETIKSRRAYGLHVDYPSERDGDHATIIENCIVYSSSYTPIGAGMNSKQKQIYRNSDFIYDSKLTNEQGAVYIHSSKNSDKPRGLIIENCNIVSKNDAYTIHLPNVDGAEYTWQKIPVTLRRNITATTGETELITDKNYLSLLSIDSKLNSNENINY